ncbi:hypothetical protein OTU49_007703 [Cherax quadricarinatus]|uniref:Uncharacterized protein n=1 Tax=Cherax quadricarinatus TaxID=27406 RepID=A0AAW0WFV7_CHEQU
MLGVIRDSRPESDEELEDFSDMQDLDPQCMVGEDVSPEEALEILHQEAYRCMLREKEEEEREAQLEKEREAQLEKERKEREAQLEKEREAKLEEERKAQLKMR